jgi:Protein of unknown function (DUF4242)
MPRYMVHRTFPEELQIPIANGGSDICRTVVERNAEEGVSWVHSYVSVNKRTTFCIYDAPTPEAVRKTAAVNEPPVDQITEVRVVDPYFYVLRQQSDCAEGSHVQTHQTLRRRGDRRSGRERAVGRVRHAQAGHGSPGLDPASADRSAAADRPWTFRF